MKYPINFEKYTETLVGKVEEPERSLKARYNGGDIEGAIKSAVRASLKYASNYVIQATAYRWSVSYEGQYAIPATVSFFVAKGREVYRYDPKIG